jgi:hypothetical protein
MVKYVQTNGQGYVTGIVDEPLLIGLFGGRKAMEISDEFAPAVEEALRARHSAGEGLHIDDLLKIEELKRK